jgi:hypothetical protein
VDFDNTIVRYDELFFDVASEMGLVANEVLKSKTAVREHVLTAYSNEEWTLLQSEVYGARLLEAPAHPGVTDFFLQCRARAVPVYIVSHKTQFATGGNAYDLHRSALGWLEDRGFFAATGVQFDRGRLFFAKTREEKLGRIARLACTHFIDDLPELFAEPAFPVGVRKILFDPCDAHIDWNDGTRARTWAEIMQLCWA